MITHYSLVALGRPHFYGIFSTLTISSGRDNAHGTLANVSAESEVGFSFLRLVGVVYMKKHASGFNGTTPEAYFNRSFLATQTTLQNHEAWLENIRQCIWDRIQFENEMIPNNDALHRHWRRVCWVLDLWAQADSEVIVPKPLSDYVWKVKEKLLL